jgi:hypothetical protein
MMADGIGTALPHLRAINPQVATILATAAAKGGPRPLLPRQGGPRAVPGGATASNMGVSSFAFQVGLQVLSGCLRRCNASAGSSCDRQFEQVLLSCRGQMRTQSCSKRRPGSS